MKRILALTFFIIIPFVSIGNAAPQPDLTYFKGIVEGVQGEKITVAGTTFVMDKHVIVRVHQRKKNALYEVPGKLNDIAVGAPVYLRVAGRKVFEITLERWKQ